LRIIDVLLFLVFSAHAFALACLRDTHGHLPRTLKFIVCGFGLAIAISFVYGAEHSGHNFFFDWRALALGLGFYITYRFWVQMPAEAKQAVQIFAVVASLRILVLLAAYLLGLGDSLLGVRIPTFDGPTISTAVFTALLGISMSSFTSGVAKRVAWLLFATVAMILVVICFRRTYWAELALGMAIMAVVGTRHRLRGLVLLACIAGVGWLAMGPSLMDRLTSFDFTSSDNPYATDNVDHVGDVLDAWDQVRASPVMGMGLGRSYATWRIRNWKDESVMVHNAPLHVWLKYGLLGLGFYLAYHLLLLGLLWARARRASASQRAVISATLAYLAAQFFVSLGFTPWPYSAVQSTNLTAFLLAVAFVREASCSFPAFRSSPQTLTAPPTWKTQYSA
jgi:O-antigen ligase